MLCVQLSCLNVKIHEYVNGEKDGEKPTVQAPNHMKSPSGLICGEGGESHNNNCSVEQKYLHRFREISPNE